MKIITKIISSFVLVLFLIPQAFADCTKPVTFLNEKEVAPCNGYLYTKDYDAFVRIKLDEGEIYQKLLELEKNRSNILETRLKLSLENERYLEEQNRLKEKEGFWQTTIYFFGGVIVTGLLASSLSRNIR